MNRFIIDASVGAKWVFEEELSDKAALLLKRIREKEIEIIVPGIFYAELASTCWLKVKRKLATVEESVQALDNLLGSKLYFYSDHELSDVALENALRFDISVYDGMYLALAEIYLAPLVTADQKLLQACQKRFEFIESLRDLKLK